jgi:thiamine pyrophosphate-dependent acetolactate synthase large subunit-like protein
METQKIKLRGADYIVKLLECLGADNLFAYPGGAILPIYDALAFSKVKNILVRHEQGGALAANGYARVTRAFAFLPPAPVPPTWLPVLPMPTPTPFR